ncbi:MAG: mandelate racemase [Ramlibacter sp.]
MNSLRLRVAEVQLLERQIPFRVPFRFGAVVTTQSPQAYVRVRIELDDGRGAWGCASQLLGAKWFDKNPARSAEQNYADLREAVALTASAYLGESSAQTAYGLHAAHYHALYDQGRAASLKPLVTAYGPALLDIGIADALFRCLEVDAYRGLALNLPGIAPELLLPEFTRVDFSAFLGRLVPAGSIQVRHTVGLADPLRRTDLATGNRVSDGLPETLEEVIEQEGPRFFKIKLSGDADSDLRRLHSLAPLLDAASPGYAATMDGNEQFASAQHFADFWGKCTEAPALDNLLASTLFVEQPIARDSAMKHRVDAIAGVTPVIIDESDDTLDAFPQARAMGYQGVSSKSCKGLYKSLINRARCELWTQEPAGGPYIMSGEDLTTQPGVSLQQDLALANALGLAHIERNGHHYVDGMVASPAAECARFVQAHPDLYIEAKGSARLRIARGQLSLRSLACHGFGVNTQPDWDSMAMKHVWSRSRGYPVTQDRSTR